MRPELRQRFDWGGGTGLPTPSRLLRQRRGAELPTSRRRHSSLREPEWGPHPRRRLQCQLNHREGGTSDSQMPRSPRACCGERCSRCMLQELTSRSRNVCKTTGSHTSLSARRALSVSHHLRRAAILGLQSRKNQQQQLPELQSLVQLVPLQRALVNTR